MKTWGFNVKREGILENAFTFDVKKPSCVKTRFMKKRGSENCEEVLQ